MIQDDPSLTQRPPRVSMIMPVYNGADYLEQAIQSMIAQDFEDWELLCIDDGSRDESAAIMAKYAAEDGRIRHLSNEHNIGLPATLNCGFAKAHGELHSWTSHDNILRPNMLSTLVAKLDEQPEVDIVYAGYSIISGSDKVTRYVAPRPIEDRWFCNPVGAAFLYRRDVTDKLGGYDVSLFGAEDYDYWMRAARQFKLQPVETDLYLYRRHEDSLTNTRSRDIKKKVAYVLQRELEDVPDLRLRARALLQLVTSDWLHIEWRLAWLAFTSSPIETFRQFPKLIWHMARVIWHSTRRKIVSGSQEKKVLQQA